MINKTEFIAYFFECIDSKLPEISDDLIFKLNHRELPNWDSIAFASIIVMIDINYQINMTVGQLSQCKTIEDIYRLISKNSYE